MKKGRTRGTKPRAGPAVAPTVTVQMALPMLAAMTEVGHSFQLLRVDAGRQGLTAMMEHERTALCGPKWIPNPAREAVRAGRTSSLIVLGGRQIEIKRPGHGRRTPGSVSCRATGGPPIETPWTNGPWKRSRVGWPHGRPK